MKPEYDFSKGQRGRFFRTNAEIRLPKDLSRDVEGSSSKPATHPLTIEADKQEEGRPMYNPPHPGDVIRTEIIEANGFNVTNAAKVLGVSRQALS